MTNPSVCLVIVQQGTKLNYIDSVSTVPMTTSTIWSEAAAVLNFIWKIGFELAYSVFMWLENWGRES